jgi:hypothetical protein
MILSGIERDLPFEAQKEAGLLDFGHPACLIVEPHARA